MKTYVALLRGINVGGNKKIAMADLRELVELLGFEEVKTLLQSGNLIFRGSGAPAKLEKQLESEVAKKFGMEVVFFVRDAAEWERIVDANPFPKEAKNDPGHFVVMCLRDAPDAAKVATLQKAIVGREVARIVDRTAYIVYPDGQGTSKLTNALIERTLGTRGTARNWNTVLKIAAALK